MNVRSTPSSFAISVNVAIQWVSGDDLFRTYDTEEPVKGRGEFVDKRILDSKLKQIFEFKSDERVAATPEEKEAAEDRIRAATKEKALAEEEGEEEGAAGT